MKSNIVKIPSNAIRSLDLSPIKSWVNTPVENILSSSSTLQFQFDWALAPEDPRELSECPELRLWSLHADANYPWLPLLLDRSSGHLAQHVAMLIPHSFSQKDGLNFALDSLELWLTHRLFLLDRWSINYGLSARQNMIRMSRALGYELNPSFWLKLDERLICNDYDLI
uniref:DUF1817 domain-containing protein n=1 Tax=Paulinella chromatophora TaxID=39717 RepID=B1X5T9_PAUCH|nr:hypothetical protein PCC_0899 [Paulinella chromatophora]ACB43308.1 hypothetical protein PCC_0899 [Paulinella chromatophora]